MITWLILGIIIAVLIAGFYGNIHYNSFIKGELKLFKIICIAVLICGVGLLMYELTGMGVLIEEIKTAWF